MKLRVVVVGLVVWLGAWAALVVQPAQSQQIYRVEFLAEGADRLNETARQAIISAANTWRGESPVNGSFYLIGLRWGSNWAIGTLSLADLSSESAASMDESDDTRITPQSLIALLLVATESGWQAALDVDPNVQTLLDFVPEAELSAEAKAAIFPSETDMLRPMVTEGVQQQYDNYKLPWQAGKPWARTYSWHGGTWSGRFPENNSLDFDIVNEANADILASAPGIVTHICRVAGEQQAGIVVRTSGTNELLGYLHLQSATIPNNVSIGAALEQGNYLGQMVEGNVNETCGYSIGTHVHLFLPTRPFTMDGYTFSDANTQGGVMLYSTLPGGNPFPPSPTNEDIAHNGDFSSGFNRWTTRLDTTQTILYEGGNPYAAWKGVSGSAGAIAQNLNFAAPAGSVLEIDLELGNTTPVTKQLRVHLHRYHTVAVWDDLLVCDFYLPPNTPLQTYIMRGQINNHWEDIRIWIESWPADNLDYVLTDTVRVRRYTSLDVAGTQCLSPTDTTAWDFRFDAEPQGWTVGAGLAEPSKSTSGIRYDVTTTSAALYSPTLTSASADAYRYIRVEMASTADTCGQMYFVLDGQRTFAEAQSVTFDVLPDGQMHTYTLDMGENAAWSGKVSRLRLDPVCSSGVGGTFILSQVQLSSVPPDFGLTAPLGLVNVGYGNPTYTWNHIEGANYYALYLGPARDLNQTIFFDTLAAADYCADGVCSVDLTTLDPGAWIANGTYQVYMSLSSTPIFAEWVGPFEFTLNARQPEIPTLTGVTGTMVTSRPTFRWKLEGRAADASWFHWIVASQDSPPHMVGDHWISRRDACGSMDGVQCEAQSPVDLVNGTDYSLYIQSWGPGGLSAGGFLGWAGPLDFSLNVPPAGVPDNLDISDVLTGKPTLTWTKADYATWYQVWVGKLNPLITAHSGWYLGAEIGCDIRCSITLPEQLPGGTYAWYVQAWGAGGFYADALDGWTQGASFVVSP